MQEIKFPFQGLPKYTQTGIFGIHMYQNEDFWYVQRPKWGFFGMQPSGNPADLATVILVAGWVGWRVL
jgi:hypothetical protein